MTDQAQGRRVIIVGAGHGGMNAAAALRQSGFAGEIILIGDEPVLPYHRPPLSKAFLDGSMTRESLYLRPESFYEKNDIVVRLGVRVDAVDAAQRSITLDGGETISWDKLILATGSTARPLQCPGSELGGVHTLRTLADSQALRERLGSGKRLVIIGAGYVGLEVAASARAMHTEVVVLEREPRILARVACEELSGFFERYHSAHGVEFRTGVSVVALHGTDTVNGVELAGGDILPCDAVLVGIGGSPCDALASSIGLQCDNGVIVDAAARTSLPDIYAIGDMTRRPMPHYQDQLYRLESVPNALDQAKAAAADIVGKPPPTPDLPWFWSDQYDLKLQIAGVPFGADARVVRGELDAGNSFSITHLAGDRIVAIEAVNAAADFVAGKKLITAAQTIDVALLADRDIPMKTLIDTIPKEQAA